MLPMQEMDKIAKKSKNIGENLSKWCHSQVVKAKKEDSTGYERRHKRWLVNWLMYEGRQYGAFDRIDGNWIDAIPTKKNNFYIDNQFSWLIDSSQKEAARAKTRLIARPVYDSVESEGAARKGTDILAHEQKRLRSTIEYQGESLTAAMCGVFARYTTYNVHSGNVKGQMPRYKQQTLNLAEGAKECLDCGFQTDDSLQQELGENYSQNPNIASSPMDGGIAKGFKPAMPSPAAPSPMQAPTMQQQQPMAPDGSPAHELAEPPQMEQQESLCPQCGMPMQEMPPVTMQADVVEGYDEVNAGEIVSWNVDPFEIKVHPKARMGRVKTTPYIYWEFTALLPEIEAAFPWADTKKMKTGSKEDSARRYQRNLERSGGGMSENEYRDRRDSSFEDSDTVTIGMMFCDRVWYQNCTLEEDQQLANGKVIPAGVPLGEIFTKGMTYIMAGSQLLDIWDEDKNDHWVMGCYRIMPTSFWGRGVEDAVQDQKLHNDVYNLYIESLRYCSAPTAIGNSQSGLDSNDFSGNPGEVAWLDNWPLEIPVSNAYVQMPPPPMPTSIVNFLEMRRQAMQAKIGSFSTASGAPDVDISTATGIKILREASVALIAMFLQIRAQVDAEWGAQILKLARENWVFAHPVSRENEFGMVETQWFSQIDIDEDLEVSFEEGSVTPRSEIEKRNDLMEALNPGGIPLGPWNKDLPLDVRRQLAETFGIAFNANELGQVERVAKIRCDQLIAEMENTLQVANQQGLQSADPQEGNPLGPAEEFSISQIPLILQMVPIDPLLDDHDVHMAYIKKWALTDQAVFGSEAIRSVMRARYQEHMQAKTMQMQMEMASQVQAQMPAMAAQAQMQPPPPSQPPAAGKKQPKPESSNAGIEDPYA